MKIIYMDTETTGVNFNKNELVQVAGIIEINKIVVEEFNIYSRPLNMKNIDPKALKINGFTKDQLLNFPIAENSFKEFYDITTKHINIDDKYDRFIPAGQKIGFDIIFIKQWMFRNSQNMAPIYLFNHNSIDLNTLVLMAQYYGYYKNVSTKLTDICMWLGVKNSKPHDALNDIKVTRECILKIMDMFRGLNGVKI